MPLQQARAPVRDACSAACESTTAGAGTAQGQRAPESPAPPPKGFQVVSSLLAFPRRGLASGHSGQQTQGWQDAFQ